MSLKYSPSWDDGGLMKDWGRKVNVRYVNYPAQISQKGLKRFVQAPYDQ